ncbi:Maf family protein [Alkalihalobacillus trypoxylicola]|uniref:dTTP/UTP pyrophosphatase n=1 Tax=Alkalihalobacillus trypoxylicola TaxID=519424 RepID=A0A162ED41_9BACI|nr:Maf family protein [Alkalihalobacillus trypoxylicola]KYG32309.1 septum formation inhibitor Maf [Alkalihalobacillus trypoxylicola]
MIPFILASSSPRRKQLLEQMRVSFETLVSDVEEELARPLPPDELVLELASQKATAVLNKRPDSIVLGADTIVSYEQEVLGKPRNKKEAIQMLKLLSGQSHDVFTGVSIRSKHKQITFFQKTTVTFYPLTDDEIENYVKSGEPFDKAGSYAIQGLGAYFVKEIRGDYFTIVGLPVAKTIRALAEFQVYPKQH